MRELLSDKQRIKLISGKLLLNEHPLDQKSPEMESIHSIEYSNDNVFICMHHTRYSNVYTIVIQGNQKFSRISCIVAKENRKL